MDRTHTHTRELTCVSKDGEWIVFSTDRNGDGNSDIYRVHPDGTGLEPLMTTPSTEDAGALSPDGTKLAFVSTADGYKANIWVKDLTTGELINLTGTSAVAGDPSSPDSYFQPSWSPDGEYVPSFSVPETHAYPSSC